MYTVRKCQTVCRQLDEKAGTFAPEFWFWPLEAPAEDDEDEQPQELPDAGTMLQALLHYLRSTHHYCTWCGVKYSDIEDLSGHCPGIQEADHEEAEGGDFDD